MAGPAPGSGHRRHPGGSGTAARLDVVGSGPPQGPARGRRVRADRSRYRRRLRGERSAEAGGGRGAALPRAARGGRTRRGVPRHGRLVLPEQPRHPGRRAGRRHGRAQAAPRRCDTSVGRGRSAAACPGGGPLPPRRPGRRGPRRRCGGGRGARAPATGSAGGVTAGGAVDERSRPRGRRPRQRPGCPRPGGPGWNSRGPSPSPPPRAAAGRSARWTAHCRGR